MAVAGPGRVEGAAQALAVRVGRVRVHEQAALHALGPARQHGRGQASAPTLKVATVPPNFAKIPDLESFPCQGSRVSGSGLFKVCRVHSTRPDHPSHSLRRRCLFLAQRQLQDGDVRGALQQVPASSLPCLLACARRGASTTRAPPSCAHSNPTATPRSGSNQL